MKKTFTSVLFLMILLSCSDSGRQEDAANIPTEPAIKYFQKDMSDEVAGSSYIKKAHGYSVISGNDTSSFMPIFIESKTDLTVSLDLNLPYRKHNLCYADRLRELELILTEASKEYSISSISSVDIGRLILTGDLAVHLTEQYKQLYNDEKIFAKDYDKISSFLKTSKLADDMSRLFAPYNLEVNAVSIEKTFFTSKSELCKYALLETDSTAIPEKILDCITWVQLQNKH